MSAAGDDDPLLDGATLRQLQRLRLRDLDAIVRALLGDVAAGSGSGGRGIEFAEYRPYAPGDDLRRIDWNVYARLRQPFVRTSPQDSELGLALLLDGSRSMGDRGAPARRHAERIAALLGAVALMRGGVVQLTVLADGDGMNGEPLSGEQQVPILLDQLEHLPRGRSTDLAAGIGARRPLAAGVEFAALLTDALIDLPALDEALAALRGVRAATLLHVTEEGFAPAAAAAGAGASGTVGGRTSGAARAEREPLGPVELIDRETGESLTLDVTPELLAAHAAALDEHTQAVAQRCRALGVGYVHMPAGVDPFAQVAALADAQELLTSAR
ncbi:DUF58 domain-containing protein [Conexibacter sp. CPCC 206217]|uniref:DUF58 domain-containing protein n=1 Tax=Conexibacter sp. CPCC 206217 TaxID=3064574 RepID=UPI00272558CB|nr:DUF58 domain-containing protein [Conexibacter sp. CPCC 206217]MDO8210598.1 DUF58 domain-containing protein [Conexibacter sp. CPCC 206217]